MAIKWIKEVDTGELIPIEDDFYCEAPAHLTVGEPIKVDYDKTLQFTIEQLENQLADLKNQAETIENEKTFDNNSIVTVNDVSPEIVSESGFKKDCNYWYPLIILILVCAVFAVFVILVFRDDIKETFQNTVEYQTVAEQELEEKQAENEDKIPLTYIISPLISLLGIKFAINFMKHTIDGV